MRAFLDAASMLATDNDLAGQFILATPLLGAGAGGLGAVASLDAMMGAVHEHMRASSPEQRDALANSSSSSFARRTPDSSSSGRPNTDSPSSASSSSRLPW